MAAQVRGVQVLAPHLFGPPAPQTCPEGQVPQLRALPQPSLAAPQLNPSAEQVVAAQVPVPHLPGPPTPQVCPDGQVPQLRALPQPSPAAPQTYPSAEQVVGVQLLPHCPGFAGLPPQV